MIRLAIASALVLATNAHAQEKPEESDLVAPAAAPAPPAQALTWTAADDGAWRATLPIAARPDLAPTRIDLAPPQGGYLFFEQAGGAPLDAAIDVETGAGVIQSGQWARVAASDSATAVIALPAGWTAGPALARLHPERDVTEPNDDPLLAWPIELWETNEAILAPAADDDQFRFTLAEPTRVQVTFEGAAAPPRVRFLDPATGDLRVDGPRADLAAGEHIISLRLADGGQPSLEPILFQLVQMPPELASAAAPDEPPALSIGVATIVTPGPDGVARFTFEAEEPGFYWFSGSNFGPDALVEATHVESGEQFTTAGFLHLDAGDYAIALSGLARGRNPAILTLYRRPLVDAFEPNDMRVHATEIPLGERFEALIEHATNMDWYTFSAPADGRASVFVDSDGACSVIYAQLDEGWGRPAGLTQLTATGGGRELTLLSGDIAAGTVLRFGLTRGSQCLGARRDAPTAVTVSYTRADAAPGDTGEGSIYVVGVELADGADVLRSAAARNAVAFIDAENASVIGDRIEEIARVEAARGRGVGPIIALIAVSLLTAALGLFGILTVRSRRTAA